MNSRRNPRRLVAAVLVGVLAGGGLMATTPAGAEVAQSATTNWKKIWTKKIQPHADARYYKKTDSDSRYSTKAETSSALAGVYSKAEADGRFQPRGSYAPAGSSFTKVESDARYAPRPTLIRGAYAMEDSAGPIQLDAAISFGTTLSSVPVPHFIAAGAPVPPGCSGTAAAPNAAAGHLCIFEKLSNNVASRGVFQTSTFGAVAYISPSVGGSGVWSIGSWAVRPTGLGAVPDAGTVAAGARNGTPAQASDRSSSATH